MMNNLSSPTNKKEFIIENNNSVSSRNYQRDTISFDRKRVKRMDDRKVFVKVPVR